MAEKKFIDAEDIKAAVEANDWSNPVIPDVVGMIIDRTPAADVVEVVRCKDCRHSTINGGDCNRIIVHYVRNEVTELNEAKYIRLDYCSYGERKEQT